MASRGNGRRTIADALLPIDAGALGTVQDIIGGRTDLSSPNNPIKLLQPKVLQNQIDSL